MTEHFVPEGYYFTKNDTWVASCEDGKVHVGITDYAQKKLKRIEYLTLPEVDEEVCQFETMGEVESTKSLSELIAPVTGKVCKLNDAAIEQPMLLNEDPYQKGWILEIACADFQAQISKLMNDEAYRSYRK